MWENGPPMMSLRNSQPIFVVGMHRSGTSAITRVLNLLGVDLGDDLLPPAVDNETGFWESRRVVEANDAILASLSSSWDSPHRLPEDWWKTPRFGPTKRQLLSLLREQFGDSPLWTIKDPRLSLTAPLWTDVLSAQGGEPRFIILIRDPREVADSIALRKNRVPAWQSHALWLRYTLAAEENSRDWRRVFVSYTDLVHDWRGTLRRVGEALDLEWPGWDTRAEAAIDAFLDPTLWHHEAVSEATPGGELPASVLHAYAALREVDDGSPEALFDRLHPVIDQLKAADELLGPGLVAGDDAASRLAAAKRAQVQGQLESEKQVAGLRRGLEAAEAAGVQAETAKDAGEEEISRLQEGARALDEALESERRKRSVSEALRGPVQERLDRLVSERDQIESEHRVLLQVVGEQKGVLKSHTQEIRLLRSESVHQSEGLRVSESARHELLGEIARSNEITDRQRSRIEQMVAQEQVRRSKASEMQQRLRSRLGKLDRRASALGKRVPVLLEDLAHARGAIRKLKDRTREQTLEHASASARIEKLQNQVEAQRQEVERQAHEIAALGSTLSGTTSNLEAHQAVVADLYASQSWRITRPLRLVKAVLRRTVEETHALVSDRYDLSSARPCSELLPGRPLRQQFRAPVDKLSSLGIPFYTYGLVNETSVRVRLLERRRFGAPKELESHILTGTQIRDSVISRIELRESVTRANERDLILEIESMDGAPGRSVTNALVPAYYHGEATITGDQPIPAGWAVAIDFNSPALAERRGAIAFISGCPGDAARYRCEHVAESLRFLGYAVEVFPPDVFPWAVLLGSYPLIVAHRVPLTPEFEYFLIIAKKRGVQVIFETDDLVFDTTVLGEIDAYQQMETEERKLFANGIWRYRQSLSLCDAATVSTESLRDEVRQAWPETRAVILRNRVGEEMVTRAAAQRKKTLKPRREPVLAYLSGTRTHVADFAECVPALLQVFRKHRDVRLLLVGHIDTPEELAGFANRIGHHDFVHWRELPAVYQKIDINLAPLAHGNRFTDCKSELKYIEAALLEVPTVASNVGGFRTAIEHGCNGYLCDDTQDWVDAIEELLESKEAREVMGRRALADVQAHSTSRGAAADTLAQLTQLAGTAADTDWRPSVAFVLRAPIAGTGGGYKKIFQLAHHLADHGHEVDLYIEPIAHLAEKSEDEIRDFCAEHFGASTARVHRGHGLIRKSDVAVATNWPTAFVVNALVNTRLKTYFVQDYEPLFYDEFDPLHQQAEATYDLPLLVVSIGSYLAGRLGERNGVPYPYVDFALAGDFFEAREAVEAKLAGAPEAAACSVLFFARPEIPRRCFELGVAALAILHERCPHVEIRLYGMDEQRELPFAYVNLGVIDQAGVAQAMREADIHLSFSMTNASTVMFEAMASGCATVELDEPGVRLLLDDSSTLALTKAEPEPVAETLCALADSPASRAELARRGYDSVQHMSVENMCSQFEAHLSSRLLGRDSGD
jgi:glycosyltransferase involved in cell wall biosynthesis